MSAREDGKDKAPVCRKYLKMEKMHNKTAKECSDLSRQKLGINVSKQNEGYSGWFYFYLFFIYLLGAQPQGREFGIGILVLGVRVGVLGLKF